MPAHAEAFNRDGLSRRILSVTPDARRFAPTAMVHPVVIERAERDGVIISPLTPAVENAALIGRSLIEAGQLFVKGDPSKAGQTVKVYLTETVPRLVFFSHKSFRDGLYDGRADEEGREALARILLFSNAVSAFVHETGLQPNIWHIDDWPMVPIFFSLDREGIFGPRIFTLKDVRYHGVFEQSAWQAFGSLPRGYNYYQVVSLAYAGLLSCLLGPTTHRVVLYSKEQMTEVVSGHRTDGGDWGLFPDQVRALLETGQISTLFRLFSSAQRFAILDLLDPAVVSAHLDDGVIPALKVYNHVAATVAPGPESLMEIPRSLVYELVRRGVDFTPVAIFSWLLAIAPPTVKKSLESLFIDFDPSQVASLLAAKKESLSVEAFQIFFDNFFSSLAALKHVDWRHYKEICHRALFDRPRLIEDLETIASRPLLGMDEATIALGKEKITGRHATYADLLLVTMSGGLGTRLGFNIEVTASEVKIPSQIFSPEAKVLLSAKAIAVNGEKAVIPRAAFTAVAAALSPVMDTFARTLIARVVEKIEQSDGSFFVNIPKGVYCLPLADGCYSPSLFAMQARAIHLLSKKVGRKIVWGVMLSPDNQEAVKEYFARNIIDGKYFGLLALDQVVFKTQGVNPVIKVVNKEKRELDVVVDSGGSIVSDANGHGGFHEVAAAILAEVEAKCQFKPGTVLAMNIENIAFNCRLADLDFMAGWLGEQAFSQLAISVLCSPKASPTEAMGIIAAPEHLMQVVEYNNPGFTVKQAFAYSAAAGKTHYFARTPDNRVIILNESGLNSIFNDSFLPGTANWKEELKNLKSGYSLIGRERRDPREKLYATDDHGKIIGEVDSIAGLGELNLDYGNGNTNIFLFDSRMVELIAQSPESLVRATYKPGSRPDGAVKIEGSIFDCLAVIEFLKAKLARQSGADFELKAGVVSAPRTECFAPLKGPDDLASAIEAYQRLSHFLQ